MASPRLALAITLTTALLAACGPGAGSTNLDTSPSPSPTIPPACTLVTLDDAAAVIGEPAALRGSTKAERAESSTPTNCSYAAPGAGLLDPGSAVSLLVVADRVAVDKMWTMGDSYVDPATGATVTRIDDLEPLAYRFQNIGDRSSTVSLYPDDTHTLTVNVRLADPEASYVAAHDLMELVASRL